MKNYYHSTVHTWYRPNSDPQSRMDIASGFIMKSARYHLLNAN